MWYQILALLIWSSSFVAAKYAEPMLDAVLIVQIRLLIAALLVLPTALKYAPRLAKHEWLPLLAFAFVNYVVVFLLQFIGLTYTSAANAITLLGLEPLMMVFVGHFFFGDKARWFHWLCGALAFLGVYLLVAGGAEHSGGKADVFGGSLVLLGGLVFCMALRPTKKLIARIGAPSYTALSLVLGALSCIPITLLFSTQTQINWTWQGSIGVLYLGIACNWLAYWLWNRGMSQVSANTSGLLIALEPVFGVLFAILLLGEHLAWLAWVGVALIICSTIAASLLPKFLDKNKIQAA